MNLDALRERWRAEASLLRRRGAAGQAEAVESCLADLDTALAEEAEEQVPLTLASEESGYSVSQLRRLFPGQRSIRRGDLPRKGARTTDSVRHALALLKRTS